jgi:hypothetical protein
VCSFSFERLLLPAFYPTQLVKTKRLTDVVILLRGAALEGKLAAALNSDITPVSRQEL